MTHLDIVPEEVVEEYEIFMGMSEQLHLECDDIKQALDNNRDDLELVDYYIDLLNLYYETLEDLNDTIKAYHRICEKYELNSEKKYHLRLVKS